MASFRRFCSAPSMAAGCISGICTAASICKPSISATSTNWCSSCGLRTTAYGFVNCVMSLENLSSSIWTWYREGGKWAVKKVIEIPAEPASEDQLPPMLKGFKACPPLVTDIDLSMDDKFLYVACWGTGDLQQYDVSDPFKPKLTGKVRIGGIVSKATHPAAKNGALSGGPQMVEISRDGRRVYFTNSLYGAIDPQFYPDAGKAGPFIAPAAGTNG